MLSQCGACGARFASAQELGAHVRRRRCHGEGGEEGDGDGVRVPGDLRCGREECGFETDSLNMLLYHSSLVHHHHDGGGKTDVGFRCHLCGRSLATRWALWEHVRTHGEAHRCPECYRVFGTAQGLADHAAAAHPKERVGAEFLKKGQVRIYSVAFV